MGWIEYKLWPQVPITTSYSIQIESHDPAEVKELPEM